MSRINMEIPSYLDGKYIILYTTNTEDSRQKIFMYAVRNLALELMRKF